MGQNDPTGLVRPEQCPVGAAKLEEHRELCRRAQKALQEEGVFVIPDFVTPEALRVIRDEANALAPRAHHMDRMASPYPYLTANDGFNADHVRQRSLRTSVRPISHTLIPEHSPLRALYDWDQLMYLVGEMLGLQKIYRYADTHGALNIAVMQDGDEFGWHFDEAEFVVSLVIQEPEQGGEFQCAANIRSPEAENFDRVEAVIDGRTDDVVTVPMRAGSLILFAGRYSLHRVTKILGSTPRLIALLAYNEQPGIASSDELRIARFGETSHRCSFGCMITP